MRCSVMVCMRSVRPSSPAQVRTSAVMIALTGLSRTAVVRVQVAYDVALADDAVDPLAVVADDQGADVVLGEQGEQLAHGGVGADGHDRLAGLGLDDVA